MNLNRLNVTRRALLASLTIGSYAFLTSNVLASTRPKVSVWKDPNCGCCSRWVRHMQENGFDVSVTNTQQMQPIKQQLGVPDNLISCHTATVDGYVIEGHVPASAIKRLLGQRPKARGLAVPGMPIGSPGMEGGKPGIYDVSLFGDSNTLLFQRFRGLSSMSSPRRR
jgi:hypothetical protein